MKKSLLALPEFFSRRHALGLGAGLGAAGLAMPVLAQAQTPAAVTHAPSKIGVIQAQSALLSTKDGRKAQAEFESKLDPKKKELEKKAADIRELQDKLQRGGAAMAEAAREDLTRQIDQQTKSYNRDMQDAQDEGQEEQRKVLDELTGKMMQVIDKYAQANGYSIIIDVTAQNTPVLYASNTVDITKDIIELYDKTLTSPAAGPTASPAPAARRPAAPAAPVKKP